MLQLASWHFALLRPQAESQVKTLFNENYSDEVSGWEEEECDREECYPYAVSRER